ncbi:Lrp/AsnC family transcriptional regulator [Roseovarius sp. 2305UL8-3]|uniref:Lrp/AsnC family transcriptional regulator n=1 Tax=Roseovarius conchicola TaxID=3121636 RepID=UPI00352779A3
MENPLDLVNRKILLLIQDNARRSIAEVAHESGLSTSPCHKRIKNMEKSGVILNYVANLDIGKICSNVSFLAEISLREHNPYAFRKLEAAVKSERSLVECYQVSGDYDYFARFICRDVDDYTGITERLTTKSPIAKIRSHCVLSKVKKFSGYPLEHLIDFEQA